MLMIMLMIKLIIGLKDDFTRIIIMINNIFLENIRQKVWLYRKK